MTKGIEELGTLERLMERVQTRHAGPGMAKRIDDWRTLQFAFSTVRPLPAGRLEPGRGVTLTDGVRIEPHSALRAGAARLTTMPAATRAVGGTGSAATAALRRPGSRPALRVRRDPGHWRRAQRPGAVRGERPGAGEPERSPTSDDPSAAAGGVSIVLPVAFDGEVLPAAGPGGARRQRNPCGLGTITPANRGGEPVARRRHAILFQKVVARAFGTAYHYPILAVAEVDEYFKVRYEPDPAAVRAQVSKANRIALFVHGIIGDTREMAASLGGQGWPTATILVLTFDYENLRTRLPRLQGP